jgi:predicted nucleic acid-binding protein
MRFWDTSALIPLMLEEAESGRMRQLLAEDGAIAIAPITPLEIASTLWRRQHAGLLRVDEHHDAESIFAELSARWNVVVQTHLVFNAALRLVTRHPLRTLDAMQLGAAMVLSYEPACLTLVTLDRDLADAARAEGFEVLPE